MPLVVKRIIINHTRFGRNWPCYASILLSAQTRSDRQCRHYALRISLRSGTRFGSVAVKLSPVRVNRSHTPSGPQKHWWRSLLTQGTVWGMRVCDMCFFSLVNAQGNDVRNQKQRLQCCLVLWAGYKLLWLLGRLVSVPDHHLKHIVPLHFLHQNPKLRAKTGDSKVNKP